MIDLKRWRMILILDEFKTLAVVYKNNYIVYTQPFMSTPMKSVTLLKQRTFQRGL